MTRANTLLQISGLFKEILNNPNLTLNLDMQTGDLPGWDSFTNVEILLKCEEHFSIQFKSKEIDSIRTISDLASMIEAKKAN